MTGFPGAKPVATSGVPGAVPVATSAAIGARPVATSGAISTWPVATSGVPGATPVEGLSGDPFASFVAGAFAAWSSRVVNPAFAGTPMPVTGGNVTGYNDQIGTNNLTAVGTPTVNTNGINTNQFPNLNGSSQYFTTGSNINLTTGTIACAWGIDASVSNQAMYGRQVNNATFIRYGSASSNTMIFKNEALTIATLNLPRALYTSFMCLVFILDGTNVTTICNGENLGSVAIGGTFLINGLARNQASNFVKGGHGESIISTQVVTVAQAIGISNSMAAGFSGTNGWRSGSYYDATLGNDANYGWNAAEAKQTLATVASRLWRPGALIDINGTYREPVCLVTSGQLGTQARPIRITGNSTHLGSTSYNPAGLSLVSGTVYADAAFPIALDPTCVGYYFRDGDITNFDEANIVAIAPGTYGALTFTARATGSKLLDVGTWGKSGSTYQINVGENPSAGAFEFPTNMLYSNLGHGWYVSPDYTRDEGHRLTRFWPTDGFRFGGSTGIQLWNPDARCVNGDGIGGGDCIDFQVGKPDFSTTPIAWYAGDTGHGGAPGDGVSVHGATTVGDFYGVQTKGCYKAAYDHITGSTTRHYNCVDIGSYRQIWNDNLSTYIFYGGTFTRYAGGIPQIVLQDKDSVAGSVIILNGPITLADAEMSPTSVGIRLEAGGHGDVVCNGAISYPGVAIQQQDAGFGTITNNP